MYRITFIIRANVCIYKRTSFITKIFYDALVYRTASLMRSGVIGS